MDGLISAYPTDIDPSILWGVFFVSLALALILLGFALLHLLHDFPLRMRRRSKLEQRRKWLVEQESSLEPILDTLNYPVWKRDKELKITYCNARYAKAVDKKRDAIREENIELFDGARKLAEDTLKTNIMHTVTRHIIDGEERREYKITEFPAKRGTIGIAEDLSRINEIKEELQQHISVQSDLMESTASAIAIFSADKKLQYFNRAYSNLWHLDESWLSNKPHFSDILERLREQRMLPEQADFKEFKHQQLSLFTNLIKKTESYYYLPDGTVLRVITIPHEHGGLLFSYEDMTEQINLERSYNTLMSVKKSTIDSLYEALAAFGEDGRLQLNNPRFAAMWDIPPNMLESRPHIGEVFDAMQPRFDFTEEDWQLFKHTLLNKASERVNSHEKLELKDGKIIELAFVPLPDGGMLLIFTDVTDTYLVERSLRAEKEALAEADTIKTKFLANVSYELRSPLTSIRGFTELLLEQYFGTVNPKQQEYLESILTSSERLTSLIDNILDVASIDAGYMKLDISEFDIKSCLSEALELAKSGMREKKDLQFILTCPNDIGTLTADKKRIQQIIIQLLRNAIRMTQEQGSIVLFAERLEKDRIHIGVKDTGAGIPEDEQANVFDKFHRLRADGYSGTGLGLTIAKSFVELHGGEMDVISEVGAGTAISFTMPLHNPELTADSKEDATL